MSLKGDKQMQIIQGYVITEVFLFFSDTLGHHQLLVRTRRLLGSCSHWREVLSLCISLLFMYDLMKLLASTLPEAPAVQGRLTLKLRPRLG